MTEQLDISRLGRKVWLVKVPGNVAAIWKPICERAINCTDVDEDETANDLGTVRVEQVKVSIRR